MMLSRKAGLAGLALLAAVPSIIAWRVYGVLERPDSVEYLAFARQIRMLSVPMGDALLHSTAGEASLFRMGGFPVVPVLCVLAAAATTRWLWPQGEES